MGLTSLCRVTDGSSHSLPLVGNVSVGFSVTRPQCPSRYTVHLLVVRGNQRSQGSLTLPSSDLSSLYSNLCSVEQGTRTGPYEEGGDYTTTTKFGKYI